MSGPSLYYYSELFLNENQRCQFLLHHFIRFAFTAMLFLNFLKFFTVRNFGDQYK